jgi:hypothetical protein
MMRLAHQPVDALASDHPFKAAKMTNHLARAVGRAFQKRLVDKPHESERFRAIAGRRPIERNARDSRQFALADNREPSTTWIDHGPPPIRLSDRRLAAKIPLDDELSDLGVQARDFGVPASLAAGWRAVWSNTWPASRWPELLLRDQIGMQLMSLRQFHHRLMALYGFKRDLGLELISDGPSAMDPL